MAETVLAEPRDCEAPGCQRAWTTWCPLCQRLLCAEHDVLPGGHRCLSDEEWEDEDG